MNKEISMGNLAREIMELMEVDLPIATDIQRIRPEKSEVDRLVCNNSKLTDSSVWKPRYNLKQGLKETVKWFSENSNSNKFKQYLV